MAGLLDQPSQTKKKRKRKGPLKRKLLVGDNVEVRSTEEGFHGSWHSATVIECNVDLVRRVRYTHLVEEKGVQFLIELVNVSSMIDGVIPSDGVPVNYRGVIRPVPPTVEFSLWGLSYGLCVDAYFNDAWWEGVVFDHEDGLEERLVLFPDLGDQQMVKVENLRITYDWGEISETWSMREDWLFLELIEEHDKDFLISVSVRQLWDDVKSKEVFKTSIKEWTCWVRPILDSLLVEVLHENVNLTAQYLLDVMEFENVLSFCEEPSKRTRISDKCDSALSCEGILHDHVEENELELTSCGPSKRMRSRMSNKSHTPLPSMDVSLDHLKQFQFALSSSGPSNRTRSRIKSNSTILCENNMQDHVEESQPVLSPPGPSKRTGSSIKSDTALSYEDILQDHVEGNQFELRFEGPSKRNSISCKKSDSTTVPCEGNIEDDMEENQLALTSGEETGLKRKADSVDILAETKRIKGSLGVELRGQVDKSATLKFQLIKDSKSNGFIVKGNLGRTNDLMKGGVCDPKTLNSREGDADPACTSLVSDPNLNTLVSSITDDRGDNRDNKLKVQKRRLLQDALAHYLHIANDKSCPPEKPEKSRAINVARAHLLNSGWKFNHVRDRFQFRHQYISPEGKTFHSPIKVCKRLTETKENTMTRRSEDCSTTTLAKATVLDLSKREARTVCSVSPLQKPLTLNISKRKIADFYACDPKYEPEYCPQALVELFGLGPRPHNVKDLRLKAKKHLSAMGWRFWYTKKKDKYELRYSSPSPNSKISTSLRMACKDCIEQVLSDSTRVMEGPIKAEELNEQLTCGKLDSATVSTTVGEYLPLVNSHSGESCTETSGVSQSREFKVGILETKRVRGPRKRRKDNSFPFTSTLLQQNTNASRSDTIHDRMSLAVSFSQEQNKQKIIRALAKRGCNLDDSHSSRVLRSSKRARQVIASNPTHYTPRTVLSWLIDNNVVLPREKVYYKMKKQRHRMAEGKVTRDGIRCNCCQKVYGLSSFEAHAGSSNRRPAENIYLEDGRSLLECQKQMILDSKITGSTSEPYQRIKSIQQHVKNDCICSVCHYGGTLVLCDQCPSSFHMSCIGLQELPKGNWFCPSCRCGICGQSEFNGHIDQFTDKTVLYCDQCEREYHVGCLRKKRKVKLDSCPKENWFCSEICAKVFIGLHKILGTSFAVGVSNLSWTILKFSKYGCVKDALNTETMTEHHSKLSVAVAVMHECFEPIKEPQTTDLVKDVIFNKRSVLKRLDFRGFYTVLLEKEDELISVASVRVYGGRVAEVPLVGTRVQYRRQGMCRILMNLLETKLMGLGVERLFLPAIPQLLQAWTTSFGFSKMKDSERFEFLEYTFLDFQDTSMCQKLLKTAPTQKIVGPRDQHGFENELDLNSGIVAFDLGNAITNAAKKNEKSDVFEERPVEAGCNGCSFVDMAPPVTSTLTLWRNYEKNEAKCSKRDSPIKYYTRRRKKSPLAPVIALPGQHNKLG